MDVILAIDTDLSVHERQTVAWKQYGIDILRVDTMHEAIARLSHSGGYFFVAINEDSIDYVSWLPVLRETTETPIFIITSNYSTEKKAKAISLGADVYDPFADSAIENVHGALALLEAQKRAVKNIKKSPALIIGSNITLSPSRRIVFANDIQISLNRKEFDVLHFLMVNRGRFVTHSQLLRKIWGYEEETGNEYIWRTINRIRNKLFTISPNHEYIEVERGLGYKFLS